VISPRQILVVALMLLGVLGWSAARDPRAAAHAELVRADPPPDGLLAAPPRRLDLRFSEPIAGEDGSLSVRLLDQAGTDLAVSDLGIDPADPRHVSAAVGDVTPGTATVVWTVRSAADGHTLTGSYAFRVGSGRPGVATVEGETPRAWAVATRWLTFLGTAMAAGGFAVLLLVLRPGDDHVAGARRRATLVVAGALVGVLASLAEPALQTVRPPVGTLAPSLREAIAGLPRAWWLRPAALVPTLVLAVVAFHVTRRGRPAPDAVSWLGLGGSLTALLGLVFTSHAAGREDWRAPALAADALHQWSVALWVGGLAHLTLWWAGTRGAERRAAPGLAADRPVRRFSRLALVLVAVAVGTGIANTGLVLPTLSALWTSDYGRVILLKVGALTVPLALATFNRRALRRAATALRPARGRAVRLEAALVLLVVLGGSVLALLAPPVVRADRPMIADVPMPARAAYRGQDLLVHLRFAPGKPGQNTVAVQLTNVDRTPFAGEAPALVRLRFVSLETEAASAPIDAAPSPDGWTVTGSQLSLEGWWNAEVTLRWSGQPDVVVPFYLLLPDPNLNGLDAPHIPPPDAAAAELYDRAMAAHTGVHRLRLTQAMASHLGTVAVSEQAVNDGADGSTPGYTYDAVGGWHYVVLGTTGWTQQPGKPWEVIEVNAMIPPAEWDEEYVGATGFRLGRVEEAGGESCQILTLVVPGTRGQVIAWYAWWVGNESGQLRREMMVSRSHYMRTDFFDFDAPLTIVPPGDARRESAAGQ
jgi:copper transport protein